MKDLLHHQILGAASIEFKHRVLAYYQAESSGLDLEAMKQKWNGKWNVTKDQVVDYLVKIKLENFLKPLRNKQELIELHQSAQRAARLDIEEEMIRATVQDQLEVTKHLLEKIKVPTSAPVGNGFQFFKVPFGSEVGVVEAAVGGMGGVNSDFFQLVLADTWTDVVAVRYTKKFISYRTLVVELGHLKHAQIRLTYLNDHDQVPIDFTLSRSRCIVEEVVSRVLKNDQHSVEMGLMGGMHLRQLGRLAGTRIPSGVYLATSKTLFRDEVNIWLSYLGYFG